MAAKKSTAKKSSTAKTSSDSVIVQMDVDTITTILAAVEALSEFATAVATASDDPILRDALKKPSARKSAGKSAKKAARKAR